MRIVFEDFNYCGKHIDIYVVELPQVNNLESFTIEEVYGYILDELDAYLGWIVEEEK